MRKINIPLIFDFIFASTTIFFISFVWLKYLKFNTIKSISAIIIPLSIFALVNSLLLNPFFRIFNISYENGFNTPIYRISYVLFMYSVIFLILYILKKVNLKIQFNISFDK